MLLSLTCTPAMADEQITIRPGYHGRLIIEDENGRDLGTARRLYGDTWVVEDTNGRDRVILHDTEVYCDDGRSAVTCLLGDDDEEEDDDD